MSVRASNLSNYDGDPYMTESQVLSLLSNMQQGNSTMSDIDQEILEVIKERINSPRQYGLDGEQITNDSVKDLAQLVALYKSAKNANKRKSPMKISVCRGNGTV